MQLKRSVAVLGMGRWGETWCRVLEREPKAAVTAVAGRRAAAGTGDPRVRRVPDFQEALALPGLDAVIVTLPADLHVEAVRTAVARGIPVLCEKPLVASRRELDLMLEIAEAAVAPVRVDQNYRLRPWVRAVREALPELGALESVGIRFAQPEFPADGRARLAHPLLADMSIHHLDLLRWITGQEATVRSATASRPADCAFAGAAAVDGTLELDGGAAVSYTGTWAARGGETPWDGDWVFRGSLGELRVTDLTVEVVVEGRTDRVIATNPPVDDEDLGLAWREFEAAIDGDESAGVSVADNVRSMSLVFDLAEAAGVPEPAAHVSV